MLELLLSIITIIVLIAATCCDIKKREVPDWLSYSFLFSVVGIRAIFSLDQGWNIFLGGLLGFLIFFSIGYFFYRCNQWGGGDTKLLMGLGASIGIDIPLQNSSLNLLWFFLAMLLLGAVYGLIWMLYLAVKERKRVFPEFKKKISDHQKIHLGIIVVSLVLALPLYFSLVFLPLAVFPVVFFYLFMLVGTIEKICFYKRISPEKLTEGDWLVETVRQDGKSIVEKKALEQDDILKLRTLAKKKKFTVLIKEGIPFVPSFLMGYIVVLLGNQWW